MDNLDPYLFPQNSPYVQNQNQGTTSAYAFDYGYERGAVSDSKISYLSADKIAAGTVVVSVNLGSTGTGYILLDGPNNTIMVNDGTNDRILIGKQTGGF